MLFLEDDFTFIKDLIKQAGEKALEIQKSNMDILRKEDDTIVTEADLWVQDFLISALSARYSKALFIHEENFDRESSFVEDDSVTFIIDPIDGTAMFSMRMPIWCVSVGVFVGFKPVYGFVFSPGFDMFFYSDNEHSYLNDKILKINKDIPIEQETNIFYSSEMKGVTINFPGKVRNLGSTALHACLTTDNRRNRLLAFIGKSFLWDWAGAIPVIEKAGGQIRYLNGDKPDYKKIIDNGYELEDYAVAYNCDDFQVITNIFRR